MSKHIHGNPETQRKDRQIREELRARGYEVFEIPYDHLFDKGAMQKQFYRLGRLLMGKSTAEGMRDNADWYSDTPARISGRPCEESGGGAGRS